MVLQMPMLMMLVLLLLLLLAPPVMQWCTSMLRCAWKWCLGTPGR
jgi:hypothetical protein